MYYGVIKLSHSINSKMSAESRTSININNELLPSNRLNMLRNIVRRGHRNRRCSFCHEEGHTINNCNDIRLEVFGNLCNEQKRIFESSENPQSYFEEWLFTYYLDNQMIVRAYSIRSCGSTTRSGIHQIITAIIDKFYDEDNNEDFIPFLEVDENTNPNIITYTNPNAYTNVIPHQVIPMPNIDMVPYMTEDIMVRRFYREHAFGVADIMDYLMGTGNFNERTFPIQVKVDEENIENKKNVDDQCECNICYESFNITSFVKLNCSHTFCKECIKSTLKKCSLFKSPNCAYCREDITTITCSNTIKPEFSSMIS